jgi:hypothetical protein
MTSLGPVVYAFFERHLKAEKGLSPASVRSYSDTLRLVLAFIAGQRHRPITRLAIQDLTAERVRQFLRHLEAERGNHIRTRNQRLAGLHTFFAYLAGQAPETLAEAERVAAIPSKRVPPAGHPVPRARRDRSPLRQPAARGDFGVARPCPPAVLVQYWRSRAGGGGSHRRQSGAGAAAAGPSPWQGRQVADLPLVAGDGSPAARLAGGAIGLRA